MNNIFKELNNSMPRSKQSTDRGMLQKSTKSSKINIILNSKPKNSKNQS